MSTTEQYKAIHFNASLMRFIHQNCELRDKYENIFFVLEECNYLLLLINIYL